MEFERIKKIHVSKLNSCASIPAVIQLSQYTSETKSAANGIIGNSMSGFAFSIEVYGAGITKKENLSANIKYLYDMMQNVISPRITNTLLFNKFYIYKINDYGSQSLSRGILDFTVYCYTSTEKILQKDIVIVRNFTSKVAYILLDKTTHNEADVASIDVYVELKRYFEKINYGSNDSTLVQMTLDSETGRYSCNIASLISNMNEKSIKDLSLYIKSGNNYHKVLNNINLYNPKVSNNGTEIKVDSDQINYFSYIYNILYPNPDIKIKTVEKIELSIDNIFEKEVEIYLGRADTLSYLNSEDVKNIKIYNFTSDKEFKLVGLVNGKNKIITPKPENIEYTENIISGFTGIEVLEIIPNNNYRRIFRLDFTGATAINIHKELKDRNIYKYNLDLSRTYIEVYKDGLRIEPDITDGRIVNLEANSYYLIYIMDDESITTTEDTTDTTEVEVTLNEEHGRLKKVDIEGVEVLKKEDIEDISITNDVFDPYVSYEGEYKVSDTRDITFYDGDDTDVLNCLTTGEAYIKTLEKTLENGEKKLYKELYVKNVIDENIIDDAYIHTSFDDVKSKAGVTYGTNVEAYKTKYNISNMNAAINKIRELMTYFFKTNANRESESVTIENKSETSFNNIQLSNHRYIALMLEMPNKNLFDLKIKNGNTVICHEYNCQANYEFNGKNYYIHVALYELTEEYFSVEASRNTIRKIHFI